MDSQLKGILAQQSGKTTENWAEASFIQYRSLGLANYQKNYPEIIQKGYNARVVGKAGPDWTLSLAPTGRTCHLETKAWNNKDSHFYDFRGNHYKRRDQYLTLLRWTEFGALGFYLVFWRGAEEWRLHPVQEVEYKEDGLQFERGNGWFVPCEGWPDWLGVVLEVGIDRKLGGALRQWIP